MPTGREGGRKGEGGREGGREREGERMSERVRERDVCTGSLPAVPRGTCSGKRGVRPNEARKEVSERERLRGERGRVRAVGRAGCGVRVRVQVRQ